MFVISAILAFLAPFTYMQCDAAQNRLDIHRADAKTGPGDHTSGKSTLDSTDSRFVIEAAKAGRSPVKAVDKMQKQAEKGNDPALQAGASRTLPTVRELPRMAGEISSPEGVSDKSEKAQ
jgi:hypothetical protein